MSIPAFALGVAMMPTKMKNFKILLKMQDIVFVNKRIPGAWYHGLDNMQVQPCQMSDRQIRFCELQYQMFLRRRFLPQSITDEWVRKGFIPHIVSVEKVCSDFPPPKIGRQGTSSIPYYKNFRIKMK